MRGITAIFATLIIVFSMTACGSQGVTVYSRWKMDEMEQIASGSETEAESSELSEHDCPSSVFTDVPEDAWYHEDLDLMLDRGIIKGATATTFEPETPMTRAMMVTLLYRMSGESASREECFEDVDPASFFGKAVTWATENGIIKGFNDGNFKPEENISRDEMITFLYRYSKAKGMDTSHGDDLTAFSDHETVLPFARSAFSWAVERELIEGDVSGDDIMLNPRVEPTRAQVTSVLARYVRMVDELDDGGSGAEN